MENEISLFSRLRAHPFDSGTLSVLGDMYEERGETQKARIARVLSDRSGQEFFDAIKKLEQHVKKLVGGNTRRSWTVGQALTLTKKFVHDLSDPEFVFGTKPGPHKPRGREDLLKKNKGKGRTNLELLVEDLFGLCAHGSVYQPQMRFIVEVTSGEIAGTLDVEVRNATMKQGDSFYVPAIGGGEQQVTVVGPICPPDVLKKIDEFYLQFRQAIRESVFRGLPSMREVFKL